MLLNHSTSQTSYSLKGHYGREKCTFNHFGVVLHCIKTIQVLTKIILSKFNNFSSASGKILKISSLHSVDVKTGLLTTALETSLNVQHIFLNNLLSIILIKEQFNKYDVFIVSILDI